MDTDPANQPGPASGGTAAGDRPEAIFVPSSGGDVAVLLGSSNRVLLSAEQSGGDVGLVEITLEPGSGSPPHTNTREALAWYVIEGSVTWELDGRQVDVAAGGAAYVPRDQAHSFVNRTDRPARVLLIGLPGGFEGFFLDLRGRLPEEIPAGPPPPEALATLSEVADRYGQQLHGG